MPLGWSWNYILTFAALAISLTTAFFQIRDFRERPARPTLKWIINPEFRSRELGDSSDRREASFNFSAVIENEGRNGFTLSRVTLIPENGEKAEVELQDFEENHAAKFEGHSSRELSFRGKTTLPNPHPDDVEAVVELETPAGNDSTKTTFTCLERR